MRPTAVAGVSMTSRDVYNMKRAIPRMSWDGLNLYNLWHRTDATGSLRRETDFKRDSASLFQQRYRSKKLLSGYHLDGVANTRTWERWYLPSMLPAIHTDHQKNLRTGRTLEKWIEGKETAGGRYRDKRDEEAKARKATTPITSMMFAYVERRLDVCVFRACLASSIYQARQFVVKGHVKLNGQVVTNSATQLKPGDLFTVNYRAINFLQPPSSAGKLTLKEDLESADTPDSATETTATTPEAVDQSSAAEPSSAPDTTTSSDVISASAETPVASSSKVSTPAKASSHFQLPKFAQASIFVPPYLLPNYLTCSCVYVRHPTARPGYSEIATPYDAGGEVMAFGWEWWRRKAGDLSTGKSKKWIDPERTRERLSTPPPRIPEAAK